MSDVHSSDMSPRLAPASSFRLRPPIPFVFEIMQVLNLFSCLHVTRTTLSRARAGCSKPPPG
eukprot:2395539-Rhodomonas_salina.2